jgi:hypothetical protein
MSIGTLFRYLIGSRDAILTITADRRYLGVGFLFVLSAALAREYDGKDLLHEPWHLLIPVVASLVASLLLSLLVSRTFPHQTGSPSFWDFYISMLSLFWMTAPLAWVYAIPFERFMEPVNSMWANLLALAVVSLWRVLLMTRVIQVLIGCGWLTAFVVVMFFAILVAIVATIVIPTPGPIFLLMGGVRTTPEMEHSRDLKGILLSLVGCSLPGWLIVYVAVTTSNKSILPRAILNSPEPRQKITWLWLLAVASLAIWLPILPFTQREQLLKTQVESVMKDGRIAEALAVMSGHLSNEFPPYWEPPPRLSFWIEDEFYFSRPEVIFGYPPSDWNSMESTSFDQLLDVLEALPDSSEDSWYHSKYMKRLDQALGDPALWYTENTTRLIRMLAILRGLKEGPELARKHHDFLTQGLAGIRNAPEHKKLIQAILELGQEHEEPRTK